jgi:hypothetical protein
MSSTDWTELTGSASTSDLRRGLTDSPGPGICNGGGTFCYGLGSVVDTTLLAGMFYSDAGWITTPKGGRVMAAMVKAGKGTDSGNNLLYAPFLFCNLQGALTTSNGYILGLTEEEPARIMLRKGALSSGMDPADSGMISLSADSFAKDTWVHLRLDVIEQPSGDVLLKVFQNDLTANAVTAPSWAAISGMDDFTDDSLGHATGSVPYTSGGRMGFGFYSEAAVNRYGYVDHFQPQKDNT